MFQSLKRRLDSFIGKAEKTAEQKAELTVETKVKGILRRRIKLSEGDLENILWDLQLDLIQSDIAVETTDLILERLKERLRDREIDKGKIREFVRSSLREVLMDVLTPEKDIDFIELIRNSKKPVRLVFLGINGSGKTSTIAKVAHLLMKNNFSVVFAAGDTFRAGAIEQLTKLGENLGIKTIAHHKGSDSAAVIYDAIEHAKARRIDVVLADTAGRMHTKINLMDEMKKICRVSKPTLKIFVGDALTGNDAVDQAGIFNREIGIDAIILTKMDADVKGGSALSITMTALPVGGRWGGWLNYHR
ncbi:MAG: signal recognition particle-docking protein FtsY [Candidatus Altiarchaeales archaeon ex4484_43]|nr:MAG: signal recognition particle-docking protein FtsY [Candidatus Altiarchaeales archaeon ex4484_43]